MACRGAREAGGQHPTFVDTQYRIEFFTDGDNNQCLSSAFTTMRIINSIRSCWPIVELYFMIDNQAIIEKNIYGSNEIKVFIWSLDEEGRKLPKPMIWDLLYLESDVTLPQKPQYNGPYDDMKESQRRRLQITCLSRPSFIAMSTFVNKLIQGDDTSKTPLDVIKDLICQNNLKAKIYDNGKNNSIIPQLLIPPMTMKSAIDYMNEKFGVFAGPLFRYANYAGHLCIWDLKQRWESTKSSGFTKMHKMPGLSEDPELYNNVNKLVENSADNFLTYDNVQTLHYGNAAMVKHGYKHIYVTHPHEDIAYFHRYNTDQIVSSQGLWNSADEIKYHPSTKIRKKYYYDWQGFETKSGFSGDYNDCAMTSSLSNLFKDAASIRFVLYRKIKVSLISRVGEVCYLKPYAQHEKFPGSNYEGAYLLTDTEVILTREQSGNQEDNIECIAKITGCRTAQSKN